MINVSILTKVSDCNTVLADAGQMKSSLELRIFSMQRQLEEHEQQATQLPEKLNRTQQQLNRFNDQLNILVEESDERDDVTINANNARKEIRAIEARMARYEGVGYLKKVRELLFAMAALEKVNEAITQVQNRKTELESAAAAA
jgi:chromosome segregation ATPase